MGAKRFLFTNKAMFFIVAVTVLFSTATALAEVRIVALGDSGIRGKGVPESQAYPAQLEAALRARGHHDGGSPCAPGFRGAARHEHRHPEDRYQRSGEPSCLSRYHRRQQTNNRRASPREGRRSLPVGKHARGHRFPSGPACRVLARSQQHQLAFDSGRICDCCSQNPSGNRSARQESRETRIVA